MPLTDLKRKPDDLEGLTGRPDNSNLTPAPTTGFAVQQMLPNDPRGLQYLAQSTDDPGLKIYSQFAAAGFKPQIDDVEHQYPAFPQRPSDRMREFQKQRALERAVENIRIQLSKHPI